MERSGARQGDGLDVFAPRLGGSFLKHVDEARDEIPVRGNGRGPLVGQAGLGRGFPRFDVKVVDHFHVVVDETDGGDDNPAHRGPAGRPLARRPPVRRPPACLPLQFSPFAARVLVCQLLEKIVDVRFEPPRRCRPGTRTERQIPFNPAQPEAAAHERKQRPYQRPVLGDVTDLRRKIGGDRRSLRLGGRRAFFHCDRYRVRDQDKANVFHINPIVRELPIGRSDRFCLRADHSRRVVKRTDFVDDQRRVFGVVRT